MTRDAVKRAIRTSIVQAMSARTQKGVPAYEIAEKQVIYADALIMHFVEAYVEEEIEKVHAAARAAARNALEAFDE